MAIILVDMDGVLVDFDEGHQRGCRARGWPTVVEAADRTSWDILDHIDAAWHEPVKALWHEVGFFAGLRPVPEAVGLMRSWGVDGHEVFICTAPLYNSESCAQEKLAWVRTHVGADFVRRTIVTADKTLVRGDVLLDDKPVIKGVATPTWRHLLYAAHPNRHNPKAVSWTQAHAFVRSLGT